jgi:hypothetical protein
VASAKSNGGSFHPAAISGNPKACPANGTRRHRLHSLGPATALATILCLTSPVVLSAQGNKLQSIEVTQPTTLAPSAAWTDMNVDVRAGDTLIIKASPQRPQAGPAGVPQQRGAGAIMLRQIRPAGSAQQGGRAAMMPQAPAFALMGRIGTGVPFLVSSGHPMVSPSSGKLQLARNIPPGASPQRAAPLRVAIQLLRPVVSQPPPPIQPVLLPPPPPPPVLPPSPPPPAPQPVLLPPQPNGSEALPKVPPRTTTQTKSQHHHCAPPSEWRHQRCMPPPLPLPPPYPTPTPPPPPPIPYLWIAIGLGALGIGALALLLWPASFSFEASLDPMSSDSGLGEFKGAVPAAGLRTRLEGGRTSWPRGMPEGRREAGDA